MKRTLFSFIFIFSVFLLNGQVIGDYQSVATGNWNALTTWQTWNGAAWVAPAATPTNLNANIITIQAGTTVTITAAVTIDQVVVNGTLNLNNFALTVANGAGDDVIINNAFGDFSNTTIVWNAGAAWSIAPGATLIRTGTGAPTSWQNSYSGGIANIPATANWISRRGASTPSLTTVGGVYPNLTIENNAGYGMDNYSWRNIQFYNFSGAGKRKPEYRRNRNEYRRFSDELYSHGADSYCPGRCICKNRLHHPELWKRF